MARTTHNRDNGARIAYRAGTLLAAAAVFEEMPITPAEKRVISAMRQTVAQAQARREITQPEAR